jgi:hypothetical protein
MLNEASPSSISARRSRLRSLGRPVKYLLWALAFEIVDFNLVLPWGGKATAIDIFPDSFALFLVTGGVSVLAFRDYFKGALETILVGVAGFLIAFSAIKVAIWFLPETALNSIHASATPVVFLAAITTVCIALRSLALELGLADIARSWGLAAVAYIFLQALPALVLSLAPGRIAPVPPIWRPLVFISSLIPLVLFFRALQATRRAARDAFGALPGEV